MAKKVLILADVSSSHTQKWAIGLAAQGYSIGIFSFNGSGSKWYKNYKNISVLHEKEEKINSSSLINKLNYLTFLPKLLKSIKLFNPDIVHAHYASSYGLLGALSGFKPFVISAWGTDIYQFPRKSFFHRQLLKFNLKKADRILSTSYVMKGELWKYSSKEVDVIPFGVDTDIFSPRELKELPEKNTIHIGTIKAMEDIYGIKTIIEAIELVKLCIPEVALKVFLVGDGTRIKYYKKLVSSKNLQDQFVFTGKISFSGISDYHNLLDILLNVSLVNESFGVSVIEGMACEKPVIVSNAPGLKEVVDSIGIIVEKDNAQQLAKAIIQLIESPELRVSLGKAGRKHVLNNYDFKNNLQQMMHVYQSVSSVNETIDLPVDFVARASEI